LAAVIPFLLGFILGHLWHFGWQTSLVLGACMAVTAEGTTAALLLEMKQMKTRLASIILGAGIIDDAFEILFLSLIFFLANMSAGAENTHSFWEVVGKYELFIIGIWLAFHFLPKWIQKVQQTQTTVSLISTMITVGLLIAFFSEFVGIGSVFGAFIAGLILQKSFFNPKTRDKDTKALRIFVFAFIVPFFFVNIGLNFDYHALLSNPVLTASVLVMALIGKIFGTLMAKPFVNLSYSQLHLIGWGLNSRGVMELVLAHIALEANLISTELYSAIVFMAIATTLIFPFVMKAMIKKDPKIMTRVEKKKN
jgi:Kef-type K+ transport system membrane component KefB